MTAHGTTDRDLTALIYLAGRLREETYGCGAWDQRGVEVKVAEFKGMNLAIVVEQILRHATDPEAKTPGALHRKFSPPMPSERAPEKRGNPRRGDEGECTEHAGQWADNCAGCKVEPFGADRGVAESLPQLADVNPRLADRLAALRGPEAGS